MDKSIGLAVEIFKFLLMSPWEREQNPLSKEALEYQHERDTMIKSISGDNKTKPEYWTYNQPNPRYAPTFS